MDNLVSTFPAKSLNELVTICPHHGVAYQKDMTRSVPYDQAYFDKYVGYEGQEIAIRINHFRTSVTEKYVKSILDIGIGSGEFIKNSKIKTLGFDINPVGVEWLKERNLFHDPYTEDLRTEGISFWDTLEHIPNPGELLSKIPQGCYMFVSLPVFCNLWRLTDSKHYKPDEHYWYWTECGLIGYMAMRGFKNVEVRHDETYAGRESISSFVFRKIREEM
jgi:hypothetical protein